MDKNELLPLLEALIFASGKPVSLTTACDITGENAKEVSEAFTALKEKLKQENHGIQLLEVNGSYQLATKEQF